MPAERTGFPKDGFGYTKMRLSDEGTATTIDSPRTRAINPVPMQTFVKLSQLMGGDPMRVLNVLRAFRDTASEDLNGLDAAVAACDAERIRAIAHRTAGACHLVGESDTGRQLDAIAESPEFRGSLRSIQAMRVAHARTGLSASVTRIAILIDVAEAGPAEEPASLARAADKRTG